MVENRQVNNNRTEIRTVHVVNPQNPTDGFRNLALNNTNFDIGTSATERNNFVLYQYVCQGDNQSYWETQGGRPGDISR